jgi:hypothetical protein
MHAIYQSPHTSKKKLRSVQNARTRRRESPPAPWEGARWIEIFWKLQATNVNGGLVLLAL